MNFKKVLEYWRSSIQIVEWEQLKLLLLASLNNFFKSIKYTFCFGWWVVLLLLFPMFHLIFVKNNFMLFMFESVIMIFVLNFLFFIYILSCRASLERKDHLYYLAYTPIIPGIFLLTIFSRIFFMFGSLFFLSAFFYADSKFGIRDFIVALVNSVKFILFFPTISIPFVVLNLFISNFFDLPTNIPLGVFVYILFSFFQLSFLSIFYIKIKHTHPELFIS